MRKTDSLLGYDLGSSSVKASVIEARSGKLIASATSPREEMNIISVQPGWAEQNPDTWWKHIVIATRELIEKKGVEPDSISAIGIAYQMHGLVAVDESQKVVRPSIIWCDSRAGDIGKKAFDELGHDYCLQHYLNSPGNFTASKLKWVKENEPNVYSKIHKIMLPGDFISMKMTGRIGTTITGLSEGIMWDYQKTGLADSLLNYYEISKTLIPDAVPSFAIHGELTLSASEELGLPVHIPVSYKAGDQTNNAFSLNVLNSGESAATAGTSGVIFGITDHLVYDPKSRVNTFVHVNHTLENNRYGVLMCINGTGSLNSWLRKILGTGKMVSYEKMNSMAMKAPIGSDGLLFIPFGNGSERILDNYDTGAQLYGLKFNRHHTSHVLRSAQEGIVFALNYGLAIMKDIKLNIDTVKAGHCNMFLSPLFREAFVNTTGTRLELYNTDGSQGAARGAGVGAGIYSHFDEAFIGLRIIDQQEPDAQKKNIYQNAYANWLDIMESNLESD